MIFPYNEALEIVDMLNLDVDLEAQLNRARLVHTHPKLFAQVTLYGMELSKFVMDDLQVIYKMDRWPTDAELENINPAVLSMLKRNQVLRQQERREKQLAALPEIVVPKKKSIVIPAGTRVVAKKETPKPSKKTEFVFSAEPTPAPYWAPQTEVKKDA
jgi:hypothetical protein